MTAPALQEATVAEDTSNDETTEAPSDAEPKDAKAKFREALARKSGGGGRQGSGPGSASKVGGEHGAAKASRTFRRKSGG
jgi:hypothetical protein